MVTLNCRIHQLDPNQISVVGHHTRLRTQHPMSSGSAYYIKPGPPRAGCAEPAERSQTEPSQPRSQGCAEHDSTMKYADRWGENQEQRIQRFPAKDIEARMGEMRDATSMAPTITTGELVTRPNVVILQERVTRKK